MNDTLKKGLMLLTFLLAVGIMATADRQEYQYTADIFVYPESLELATVWCNARNITPLSECADYLIEQRLESWYFSFLYSEVDRQVNRIKSSKNETALLEANQTLSGIGN